MVWTIVEKEFKFILTSPKFFGTFLVCSILILLSFFVGIQEYRVTVAQFETGQAMNQQSLRERTTWSGAVNRVYRYPDPLQIIVLGVNYDIGRFAPISVWTPVKLMESAYSQELIYAVFRFLDFNFIVVIVLSLFAILFTYDAVNGERESGTLKLTLANAVPKSTLIVAKLIGSWIGLVVPLLIPLLLGLLLLLVYQIPLSADHWLRLLSLFGLAIVYFTFFMILGLLVSSLTQRSATSFMILLVSWIVLTLIVPRAAIMIAGQIIQVPSAAEIDSQIDGYSKSQWEKYREGVQKTWERRNNELDKIPEKDREAYREQKLWSWLEEDDVARKAMQEDVARYSKQINEDMENRKLQQVKTGFALSRFSPASSFQLAAMNLAETDIFIKKRYEQTLNDYHVVFSDFIQKKSKESGGEGLRVTVDSRKGFNVQVPDMKKTISADEIPHFQHPKRNTGDILSDLMMDLSLLVVFSGIALVSVFVAFLRYDVR
ncbi:ABC transporter permease [bacterium]|nr:ABC transporter permease [bacterium]